MLLKRSLGGIKNSFILLLSTTLFACNTDSPRLSSPTHDYCADVKIPNNAPLSKYLAPFEQKMQNSTGVYVLEQGTEAMFTRAWLTLHAEKTIDVQYFIFSTDNIGILAIDYLVRAAERGVKVRILVDDFMVDAKEDELLQLDAHANISIKIYNPMANVGKNIFSKIVNLSADFHGFNQRMHNKTFTVDGKVTITGGRNVADEYFGYDHQYNFRDRDVLLLGGETKKIQNSFNTFWQHSLSEPIQQLLSNKKIAVPDNFNTLHQYACDPKNFLPSIRAQINNLPESFNDIQKAGQLHWIDNVTYVSDIPGKNDQSQFLAGGGLSTDRLLTLLQQAKKSVTIQTPYLITTDIGKSALKQLVDRGVEVKILTNSLASNDNLEAFSGYQRDRKALLNTGVKIFEFKPDAKIRQKVMSQEMHTQLTTPPIFGLHAKSMVIDNNITVIGTFNLDPRSANLNTESIVIIPSESVANSVKSGMLAEMQPENAWQISLDWNPDNLVKKSKQWAVKVRRIVPKSVL